MEEYEELKGRFEKAVMEIRAMKRELRQSHAACDELELVSIRLRQDAKCREEADRAEATLMAARIQDLALKLSTAEKQVKWHKTCYTLHNITYERLGFKPNNIHPR